MSSEHASAGFRIAVALVLAALLAGVIHVAKPLLLPMALAVVLTMLLLPLARRLERMGLPRVVAAGVLVAAFVGGVGTATVALRGPALEWMERAPRSLAGLQEELASLKGPVEQVARAADQVEERMVSLSGVVTTLVLFFLIWGPAGVLLTVPLLVSIKVVAEYHPRGRLLALTLGRGDAAVRLLRRTRCAVAESRLVR